MRPERLDEARRTAVATMLTLERGTWTMAARELDAAYGLLLLDGLVLRTIVIGGLATAELLGPRDLIVLADGVDAVLVPTTVRWTVRERSRVAVLDDEFLFAVRRWPELVAALFERIGAQSRRRSVHGAVCQLPRVEDRVQAMLWLLAERWGRVTLDGTTLPLRLTHETIGQLVGARRPTVSLAVKELERRGVLQRRPDGWLLQQPWRLEQALVSR